MTSLGPITLFVGTYTRHVSFVAGRGQGIYIYRLDRVSGELTYATLVPGVVNPSYLALARQRNFLYAVNEITSSQGFHGSLSAFTVDPVTQDLALLNQQSSQGSAPYYVSIDVIQHRGSGHDPRQDGPHAHMITPGPGGRFFFAVNLGTDQVLGYRLDLAQGRLMPLDPPGIDLRPGTGPRHLAFSSGSRFAYVIGECSSTVTVLAYDAARGAFQELQVISTLPENFAGWSAGGAIKAAPSGRFVYASNRGHDSIAIFAADRETGELSLLGHEPTQGRTPRDFAIDPSGRFLLVANQDSDTIVVFRIDDDSGRLTATGQVTSVPTPVCLRLS